MRVIMAEDLLRVNNRRASDNRRLLDGYNLKAINIIGSPGAGKTSLLEKTIEALEGRLKIGIVEGDIYTAVDAHRIARAGARVVQINTGGNCHLSASMLAGALDELPLGELDLIIIENVGNLVCPAAFDLGEHKKIVVLSVTEGDDKPVKYPGTFLAANLTVITKTDLIPYTDFSLTKCLEDIKAINAGIDIFTTSVRTGEGMIEWSKWLEGFVSGKKGV